MSTSAVRVRVEGEGVLDQLLEPKLGWSPASGEGGLQYVCPSLLEETTHLWRLVRRLPNHWVVAIQCLGEFRFDAQQDAGCLQHAVEVGLPAAVGDPEPVLDRQWLVESADAGDFELVL
jgi:hypothetical protein